MRLLFLSLVFMLHAVASDAGADSLALRRHVLALCDTSTGYRHAGDTARLNNAARYIHAQLRTQQDSASVMSYTLKNKRSYMNLVASFGPEHAPRIVIGAHYDVCGEQQGADDNASGVAGLLELARLIRAGDTAGWKYRVDLVAYSLEEPPYFRTQAMGSAVHARYLADSGIDVRGMVSLEMIGYFRDGKGTQQYPLGFLKAFYGSRGNFITSVHKVRKGQFVRQFQRDLKRAHRIPVKKFGAPAWLPGIDFSDHRNYWLQGWPAMMVTDTSFFRNANYHQKTDTPETLDFGRMAAVVDAVYHALLGQL